MPGDMSHDEKDPLFVMNSLSDRPQDWYLHSTEDLEDHHSTTSSTESNPSHLGPRKDHEFIPTRMKTISASKPAADPSQFTRVNSNPLLISAQKQLMKVEEVKKKKEVIRKVGGDDQPDWQDNLSSWKDRRRKQSEEALMRVAEVKALESEGDDYNQQKKRSIGKKLSTLLYTDEDEMDWSDLGLEKVDNNATGNGSRVDFEDPDYPHENPPMVELARAPRRSLPAGNLGNIREAMTPEPVQQDLWPPQNTPGHDPAGGEQSETEHDFGIEAVKTASRTPGGYGEGIPVLNRKTSAPVLPYGSPARAISEEKEPPSVRRKSSELSLSMKARLGAFSGKQDLEDDAAANKRIVEPDNTFREKLQTFRKISEPQPEDSVPKGPKPPLSYKTLIGNNFSQTTTAPTPAMIAEHGDIHEDHEDYVEQDDSVDQLLDDALEESFNLVEDENHAGSDIQDHSGSILADDPILPVVQGKKSLPPTEKPPPPPVSEVMTSEMEISAKNQRNLQKSATSAKADDDIDKQEQEIIASLELEEREHKKYMNTVNAYRNLSPTSSASSGADNAGNGSSSTSLGPQPFGGKKSDLASPTFGSVSPALSSDSRGGQIQSPSNSHPVSQNNSTSGPLKSKNSSPGQSVMAEPTTTTNNTPPGRSSSSQGQPLNSQQPQNSYNQQHWLIQEAEQRRIAEQQMRHYQQQHPSTHQQQQQSPVYENSNYIGGMQMPHVPPPSQYTNHQRPPPGPPTNGMTPPGQSGQPGQPPPQQPPPVQPPPQRHHQQPSPNENMYANLGQHPQLPPNFQRDIPPGPPPPSSNMRGLPGPQVPPRNPPAGSGGEGTGSSTGGSSDRLLSVSGKKKCSHCKEELGRGAAMIIESLRLFYHLRCFRCVVCHVQLGNGSTGTDVRVRNNKLHCQNCYSNDEGLKFSKV